MLFATQGSNLRRPGAHFRTLDVPELIFSLVQACCSRFRALPRQGGLLDLEAELGEVRAAYLKARRFSDEKALAYIDYFLIREQIVRKEVV